MNIKNIINKTKDVKIYEKGTAVMWTDEYISKQLLEMHTNPTNDIASRNQESINKIVGWMIKEIKTNGNKVLDLGCGPGLYTNKFSKNNFEVTGIDFSKTSIDYAVRKAVEDNLRIKYICDNYLNINFEDEFDLIIMIYCDFGVLSKEERKILLNKVYKALKKGGIFIFDALNEKTVDKLEFKKKWEFSSGGFWQPEPYLCLTQSVHFKEYKAILDQEIVLNEDGSYKTYNFWNHYFEKNDLNKILNEIGFINYKMIDNIIKGEGIYNDEGVSFHIVKK